MDAEALLFNKYRLSIMVLLAKQKSMTYNDLKSVVKTSDGNLATHLRKLEDAGFVSVTKTFEGRKPKTIYTITPEGEKELEKFMSNIEGLLEKFKGGKNK